MMIPEIAFAGHSVMTVADLLPLPPVRGKLVFSQFFDKDSIKHLLGLWLWYSFQYAELIEERIINCLLACLIKFELVKCCRCCRKSTQGNIDT